MSQVILESLVSVNLLFHQFREWVDRLQGITGKCTLNVSMRVISGLSMVSSSGIEFFEISMR